MSKQRIAVIAGDGIGKEVMPEGVRVVDAAARKFGIDLQFDHFDFASWDYCEKHGRYMPENWKDLVGGHDAIFFGAVGWPEKIPDHESLWQSLLLFRREFDQYVNLRPARLMPGIIAPVVRRDGSARQRAEATRWLMLCNADMQPVFGTFFAPMSYIADPAQHASLHASSHLKLRRLFERLDAQLEHRDWLAGFRSAADAYLFVMLRWAAAFQVDLEGLTNLVKFRLRMQRDEGVQAALGAEGLA